MYTIILTWLFFVLTFSELIGVMIASTISDDFSLGRKIVFNKVIKTLFIFEFIVFNFLFSFITPQFVYQIVLQAFGNFFSFIYFFFDFFYFSQRKRAYILWLQKNVFKKTNLEKYFTIESACGRNYEKKKKNTKSVI